MFDDQKFKRLHTQAGIFLLLAAVFIFVGVPLISARMTVMQAAPAAWSLSSSFEFVRPHPESMAKVELFVVIILAIACMFGCYRRLKECDRILGLG